MTPAEIRDMVASNVIAKVIHREGGIGDAHDGNGITRFGQTDEWLKTYRLKAPETPEQAAANYRAVLVITGLINLCDVDDSLADVVLDYAVNSGEAAAIMALQKALGYIQVDGVWGPQTALALSHANRSAMARRVMAARVRLQGRLITKHPEEEARNAEGWANRNAELIEGLA